MSAATPPVLAVANACFAVVYASTAYFANFYAGAIAIWVIVAWSFVIYTFIKAASATYFCVVYLS